MKRAGLAFVLVLSTLVPGWRASAVGVAAQADPLPTPAELSEPVRAGDWTFQVVTVERLESYYAEHAGQVFEPEGIFLIVGLAIAYEGASANDLDRFLPGLWFEVTAEDGTVYSNSASEAWVALAVEDSYRQDWPYPHLPGNSVAEPGVTHYNRYLYDVPADATGLTLTSSPAAPEEFAIPLPDPPATAGPRVWDLTVGDAELRETLEPPLTANSYEAEGVFLVVHVRLTKLIAGPAAISLDWFALQTAEGEAFEVVLQPTLELGPPSFADEPETFEFALVFDVPPAIEGATLVSTPGSPLDVEEPLTLITPPAATPTPAPPPEPGSVRVVSAGDGPVVGQASASFFVVGAIELILDTSGSMLQPMGDQLRIDVAKQVLTEAVTEQLPAGAQTALRVFGTVPGSCETSLAIPLGPLDPNAAVAAIAGLQAVNEVRTPLGASLEAAGADLEAVAGPKLIVLVTDGEETCGGDPGATIDALVARGIDVRVNIVGFAIDDPAVEQTLADWAERGGGEYFPATDAAALGPALAQALQPTFDVLDSDGFVVASGTVNGEAVSVPPGRYTVRVNTDPPIAVERVVVESSVTTEVDLDEASG